MGLIQAFKGALGGAFADQWLEYMAPPESMRDHVLLAKAVPVKSGRSANNDGQENANIISDGSRFLVPEGAALITVENGGITAIITEAGGYEYTTKNVPEARSIFAGDGPIKSTLSNSFEQFKFGGQPGNQQQAYYINMKDIAGLAYGTRTPVMYDDAKYGGIQMGVVSHGTYTIKVIDPIKLFKNFIPIDITSGQGRATFALGEGDGGVEESLFNGFVGSLSTALSKFCAGGKSIPDIQGGLEEFASDVDEAVETKHHWNSSYCLSVVDIQPVVIEWDEESKKTVDEFRKTAMAGQAQAMAMGSIGQAMAADGGRVGAAYSQATIAQGFKGAGENGGAGGMFGMGMAINQMGGAGSLTTPIGGGAPAAAPAPEAPAAPAAPAAATPAAAPAPAEPAAPAAEPAAAPEAPATPAEGSEA